MSAAERLLYFFGRPLVRSFYRVTPLGLENLPDGGFLLVPNHITWVDALILQLTCPRPIRYVIDQEYYHKRILHPILRTIGCIPISKRQSHAAVRAAAEKIAEGEIVCVFPEGELERRGALLRLQRGYEVIARHAKAQVVPVWLDQLWGSIFSFQGGKFFRKFLSQITAERRRRAEQFCPAQAAMIDSIDHRCGEGSALQTAHAVFGKMPIQ